MLLRCAIPIPIWQPAFVVLGALLSGCMTTTEIRTVPSGANVYVNDQLVGTSPVRYSTPDDAFKPPYRMRAELDGYQAAEGELTPVTATGRITGAIFTLGIVAAVRPMSTFKDSYTFTLVRDPEWKPATPVASDPSRFTIESDLGALKRLFDDGVLSAKEYQDARERVLREY